MKKSNHFLRWVLIVFCTCCLALPLVTGAFFQATAQEGAEPQWVKLGANRIALWSFSPNYEQDKLILIATNAIEKMSLRGVFRSNDHGNTWSDSSEGLLPKKRHYYTDIEFSPTFAEDKTLWLWGHKTGLGRTEAFGGSWQSLDEGLTWTEIDYLGFPFREMTQRTNQDILGVVVSPNLNEDGLMVSAAAGEGVYKSVDKGLNWELLNPVKDVTNIFAPKSFPEEPFLALATSGSQVMISTDGGVTFETRGSGLPESMVSVRYVAFSDNFATDRKMFCSGPQGVFASDDAGMTWQTIARPETNTSVEVMAVVGDFTNFGAIAYGTDDAKIFLSEDMGQTFNSVNAESFFNYKIETLALAPDFATSHELYAGSQDGIFRYSPPVSAEAAAAADAMALEVEATRSARATAAAGYEFKAKESDRVETGCIAYTIAPLSLLVVFAIQKKGRSHDRDR
ncbi:MAG: hypothetical protein MUE67_09715 [Anaerolineales bacterium]|nr:hypothetical protein [Anaerolineales bacterium]